MIGQHFFGKPKEWDQGKLFLDIHVFIHEGVGLPKEEITIHEDELSLKVLDMGLGQERVAWFSQGTPNIYEATFPYVIS